MSFKKLQTYTKLTFLKMFSIHKNNQKKNTFLFHIYNVRSAALLLWKRGRAPNLRPNCLCDVTTTSPWYDVTSCFGGGPCGASSSTSSRSCPCSRPCCPQPIPSSGSGGESSVLGCCSSFAIAPAGPLLIWLFF